MGAWKLRAIVYGMLAVVSALVLWQSGALAHEPGPPVRLTGKTADGALVTMYVRDGRHTSFDIGRIVACDGRRVHWYPSMAQANVSVEQDGDMLEVREGPIAGVTDAALRMRARLHGDRVSGVIWVRTPRCAGPPISFGATR